LTVTQAALAVPNDTGMFMSSEVAMDHAKYLRKTAADLIAIADGLDARFASDTVSPSAPVVDEKAAKKAAKKAAEDEGDRKAAAREADDGSEDFKVRMKRLSDEAQAATFTAADAGSPEPEAPAPPTTGWVCPEHGDFQLTTVKPRVGDPYLMCGVGDCEHYER
jgi:metal-dependent amidase/aminoacylase/carboxypeptidase family protein